MIGIINTAFSIISKIISFISSLLKEKGKKDAIQSGVENFTKSQIDKETRSGKYIPQIFIETIDTKEKLRYFCQPVDFYSKIIDVITKRIKNDTFISCLQKLNYPLPPLYFQEKPRKSDLRKTIVEAKKTLDSYAHLYDIVVKEGFGLKKEYYEKIPESKKYLHNYLKYDLQYGSLLERVICDLRTDFDLLEANTIILTGKAGYGKTNLICDFTKNFLQKRNLPCLYFTGRDFNSMSAEQSLEEFIIRILFPTENYSYKDILKSLRHKKESEFLFVIIDGINEHKNISLFSDELEHFFQRSEDRKIKIILTCRSEYFEERFGNLQNLNNVVKIEMNEYKTPKSHQKYLLEQYFDFFGIPLRSENVAEEVLSVFSEDKLMLRFFCEAYQNDTQIGDLFDLYRLEVFQKYLEKKSKEITGLADFLTKITAYMIDHSIFSDISLNDMPIETGEIIDTIFDENIIVRKDVIKIPDVAFGSEEVLNFVYDEFRDYLLASDLIKRWDQNSSEAKKGMVKHIDSHYPIAEGLLKYLCLWGIKNNKSELLDFLSHDEKFDQVFIQCIFSSPDYKIVKSELARIEEIFWKNPENSFEIFFRLLSRCDVKRYPNLNINFLFAQINKMDDELYEKMIISKMVYEYDNYKTNMEELCAVIDHRFQNNKDPVNYRMEILKIIIYLFGVSDYNWPKRPRDYGKQPAISVFSRIKDKFTSEELIAILLEVKGDVNNGEIKSAIEIEMMKLRNDDISKTGR